jgi:hypothetical protein
MAYLKINVDDSDKKFVEALLAKLGFEVSEEKETKSVVNKSSSQISPTLLFGKWKNTSINPATFRKELWARKK